MVDPILAGFTILVVVFGSCFYGLWRLISSHSVTVEDLKAREDKVKDSSTEQSKKQAFRAADYINDDKYHLLLCATGSVATIKIPLIVQALAERDDVSIRLIFTESAAEFLRGQSSEQPSLLQLANARNVDGIYFDSDEWAKPWIRGDGVLHIELRRWADLMAIVPLSANSLAKLALGLSDNLITSVARAWDATGLIDGPRPGVTLPYASGQRKGIIVAPAMNTAMWEHPITAKHIAVLEKEWGVDNDGWFEVLRPAEGLLACGDTGSGAMMNWQQIVAKIETRLPKGESEITVLRATPKSTARTRKSLRV